MLTPFGDIPDSSLNLKLGNTTGPGKLDHITTNTFEISQRVYTLSWKWNKLKLTEVLYVF